MTDPIVVAGIAPLAETMQVHLSSPSNRQDHANRLNLPKGSLNKASFCL
ncbi:MAG: hypothetical protein AAFW60_08050 [Pseudomonadota bacterium]